MREEADEGDVAAHHEQLVHTLSVSETGFQRFDHEADFSLNYKISLRSGFVVTSLEKFVFASHLRKPKVRKKSRDFPKPITSQTLLTDWAEVISKSSNKIHQT